MPIQIQPGILIRSDEATIVYLQYVNEGRRGSDRFILQQLSTTSVFVKKSSLRTVQTLLSHRLAETVFDEEDEMGMQQTQQDDDD
jgi:hypothetical protein